MKAPPLNDTSIVPEMPGVLYALFDYGLTLNSSKLFLRKKYNFSTCDTDLGLFEWATLQMIRITKDKVNKMLVRTINRSSVLSFFGLNFIFFMF